MQRQIIRWFFNSEGSDFAAITSEYHRQKNRLLQQASDGLWHVLHIPQELLASVRP